MGETEHLLTVPIKKPKQPPSYQAKTLQDFHGPKISFS
jgi:hypothetical protein